MIRQVTFGFLISMMSSCSKGWPRRGNSTSGFIFRDIAHLERWKSICRPNFGEISESTAKILLLPVSELSTLPVSIFTLTSPSTCHSASTCQISSKSGHPRHSYDVIFIFQDGRHGIGILLSVSFFVTYRSSGKVNIYRQTKFRRDISIHG